MSNKIVISEAHEVVITRQEFLRRFCLPKPPLHSLFDVVEYEGDYKSTVFAVIDGVDCRSGGWMYHGIRLVMNGIQHVQFPENKVLRVIAARAAETEGG